MTATGITDHDRSYFLGRAEAELSLACRASHPAAMRAHYHLAGFYLDQAYRPCASARPVQFEERAGDAAMSL